MEQEKVSIPSYGAGGLHIKGLTQTEIDWIMASIIHGAYFIRLNKQTGRIEKVNAHEPLPDPVKDVDMYPYWSKPNEEKKEGKLKELLFDKERQYADGSIFVKHICGYQYTPENYKWNVEKLISWGFSCMRSQRGEDYRYWEAFYLPGCWAAKGELEERLKTVEREHQMRIAVEFLRQKCSFGQLDITVQRLAQIADDSDY